MDRVWMKEPGQDPYADKVAYVVIEVEIPLKATLDKYGLNRMGWIEIFLRQGGCCAVCKRLPESKRLNVDHDHAPGWKKMPPEERVKYVRGLLCYWCNKSYLGKGITIEKAENMVTYLKQFASVRPQPPVKGKRAPRVRQEALGP